MAKRRRSKARKAVSNYKQQSLLCAPKPPPTNQEIIEASKRGEAVTLWFTYER
jgi:hypothetical protein